MGVLEKEAEILKVLVEDLQSDMAELKDGFSSIDKRLEALDSDMAKCLEDMNAKRANRGKTSI